MPALNPPERHPMPRFIEPDDTDPTWVLRRASVQAALYGFWLTTSACAAHIDRLDRWAGRHDAVADCGEAREQAAADIQAVTALLRDACDALDVVLAFAEARPA